MRIRVLRLPGEATREGGDFLFSARK